MYREVYAPNKEDRGGNYSYTAWDIKKKKNHRKNLILYKIFYLHLLLQKTILTFLLK